MPCLSQGHRTLPQEEGVCPESPAPNLLTTSISDKRELLPWPTFPPHLGSQIKVFKQAQEFYQQLHSEKRIQARLNPLGVVGS